MTKRRINNFSFFTIPPPTKSAFINSEGNEIKSEYLNPPTQFVAEVFLKTEEELLYEEYINQQTPLSKGMPLSYNEFCRMIDLISRNFSVEVKPARTGW